MSVYSPILAAHKWFIGEDKTLQWDNVGPDGKPLAMTGWHFDFTLRTEMDATQPLILIATGFSLSNTGVDSNVHDDRVSLPIDAAVTAAGGNIIIQPGQYFYTLRRTDAGDVTVLAYGPAVLQLAASR